MATSTGINVAKVVRYAVLAPKVGVDVIKVVRYAVVLPGSNIVVSTVTVPGGDPQTFNYTTSYGSPFTQGDSGSKDSLGLPEGTYSVSQQPVAGWTTAVSQDPHSITTTTGETVNLVFTNTKLPTLVSLVVIPSRVGTVIGGQKQFSAIATFSDTSTQDVTGLSTWNAVGDPSIATISTSGLATGVSAGTGLITAVYSGLIAYAILDVGDLLPPPIFAVTLHVQLNTEDKASTPVFTGAILENV